MQRSFHQLQAIYSLSKAVSHAESLEEIYTAALNSLKPALGTDRAAILLFDPDGRLRFKSWLGLSEDYRRAVEGHSPWLRDAEDPQPILVSNALEEPSLADYREIILNEGIRAMAFIPLVYYGRLLGKFMLYYDAPHEFDREEVQLAQTLASHVAFALERKRADEALRRAHEELEKRVEDLTRLHDMTVRISTTLDLQKILDEVLAAIIAIQDADMGMLLLYDSDKAVMRPAASVGLSNEFLGAIAQVLRGIDACGRSILQRKCIFVEDVESDPIFAPFVEAARMTGFRAVYNIPLLAGNGEILGAITTCFHKAHRPSEREVRLAELYARQAAWAIQNAQLYREAREANRLKDEFLATVSHELRTPLTAILGWTRLLRSGDLDRATFARALETVERNAKAQAQLIEDLLDISRIISGKLRLDIRLVELPPLIEAAIDSLRLAAEAKGLRLEKTIDQSAGPISGDPDRLQQVVWNLLSNAVKFTPPGGSISVRLARVGSQVEISVSDSGIGISREFLPHVFDRFRQADSTSTRSYGGLGLGLAIVRHLVELHGGTVHAESAGEGQGATFKVRLPFAMSLQRLTPALQGKLFLQKLPRLDNLQVLVVDDDPDARELLGLVLGQCGAKVTAVGSAAEALELIKGWTPDVLVSDIGMPDEDGYSLIRKVRALDSTRGSRLPAVALTAYARVEDRMRALAAGFQMYVAKPIDPGELAAVIASLAGRTS